MNELCPEGKARDMELAPTIGGCTGFDGDMEARPAGGCAYHPKNGQIIN